MKVYNGVARYYLKELEITKSIFITEFFPVHTQEEAEEKLEEVRECYKDATHHCYAYIVGESGIQMRMSDDGEPQGTAGAPMLEVLKKRGVSDTLAVVTRYFGGIKLGANGLVGAYSRCVAEGLTEAGIVTYTPTVFAKLDLGYTYYGKLLGKLELQGIEILDKDFQDAVSLTCAVKEDEWQDFLEMVASITAGSCNVSEQDRRHHIFQNL